MITLLAGENDFEITREARRITSGFEGSAERIDGSGLNASDLPGLLHGTTLFSDNRLIFIRDLSSSRDAWASLVEYVSDISADIHLVLLEQRPDKRTKTYKVLQKHADIKEFKLWTDRDVGTAEHWIVGEAKRIGLKLSGEAAHLLVQRSMVITEKGAVIDQWRLLGSLEKLAPLRTVGEKDVETYIEAAPVENVFNLLETALKGDRTRVSEMIGRLEASEDPFRLFGLLGGQIFYLAALSASDKPGSDVAKDVGAHPFVLSKLSPYATRLGHVGVKRAVVAFAEADSAMKTSNADSWILIERALLKVATFRK